MIEHLVTRFEAARLDVRRRDLRQREEAAIARLGEKTLAEGGARSGRLAALSEEAAAVRGRLHAMGRSRGDSASTGSRQRIEALEQRLRQIHLTAGRLALALPPTGAESEVLAIRVEMADATAERERLRSEGNRMVQETWIQIQAWVTPRAPALVTLLLAWWVARGYAVSHTAAILDELGLSHNRRGAHLVSLTADTMLVQYALPLGVAAACAYLAHRLAERVRTTVEHVRARSSQAIREAGAARLSPADEAGDPRAQRVTGKSR
ncbi:MAG TPA: hypothetical protein VLD58_04275 [Gemmatimonadales bacterium]|nr:hypothetical protein [Gemmatimonadales bacterium]